MKVAILHYHFERGGVTRVVESTLRVFARRHPTVRFGLVSGRPVEGLEAPSALVPELDYQTAGAPSPRPDDLLDSALGAARKLFDGSAPDVWHVHNPALGKNGALCGLVARLARAGHALLLHEHDFAEDFRPANFRLREAHREPGDPVFPHGPRVFAATINRRDAAFLADAGLPDGRSLVLPNPVPVPSETIPPPPDGADSLLYPVRALARKNLGEFLLLANVFRDRYRFVSTLPPTNPAYRGRFERWKALAAELGLPARLGVAEHEDRPFAERMAECAGVVTTSLAEGFGLAFLEPWAYGREPVGRDLPEITGEFREAGVEWPRLYRTLLVPRDRLPGDPIRAWRRGLESSYEAFGRPTPEAVIARVEAGLEASPTIDFALLGEDLQEEALRAIRRRGIPVEAPDWSVPADPETSAANRRRIRDRFSPEAYADRLLAVYQTLAEAPPGETEDIDSRRLLAAFLRPDRFRPHFAP